MSFADKVTILRILLIPLFVALLMYSRSQSHLRYMAAAVFGLAVITDFFDGLVARIKKEKSEIGQVIDPLADKLLLLTAFICLYVLKFKIPLWVVLIIVSRDFIILLGVLILYFLKIEIPIAPSVWGKLTTFFQMITILSVIMDVFFSNVIWTIAIIFTLISGIGYFSRGVRAINARVNRNRF
jgi:cardiolipin synthase